MCLSAQCSALRPAGCESKQKPGRPGIHLLHRMKHRMTKKGEERRPSKAWGRSRLHRRKQERKERWGATDREPPAPLEVSSSGYPAQEPSGNREPGSLSQACRGAEAGTGKEPERYGRKEALYGSMGGSWLGGEVEYHGPGKEALCGLGDGGKGGVPRSEHLRKPHPQEASSNLGLKSCPAGWTGPKST